MNVSLINGLSEEEAKTVNDLLSYLQALTDTPFEGMKVLASAMLTFADHYGEVDPKGTVIEIHYGDLVIKN